MYLSIYSFINFFIHSVTNSFIHPFYYSFFKTVFQLIKKPGVLSSQSEIVMKDAQVHQFAIQNGLTNTTSKQFIMLKQYYCLSWGSITSLLLRLEKLMVDYSIPIAFIDGDRFVFKIII